MGKSTAAGFFLKHGVRVVDTDDLARQLVQPGQPAVGEIRACFGDDVFAADGSLRRDLLAQIVFANPAARQNLEAILHPRIRAAWLKQLEIWDGENCPLALVVIPLLFETNAEDHFQKIICVACSSAAQRRRLARRGWSSPQICRRIEAQWNVEQKISRSHFVIWTEGDQLVHQQQVSQIYERL